MGSSNSNYSEYEQIKNLRQKTKINFAYNNNIYGCQFNKQILQLNKNKSKVADDIIQNVNQGKMLNQKDKESSLKVYSPVRERISYSKTQKQKDTVATLLNSSKIKQNTKNYNPSPVSSHRSKRNSLK